LGRIAAATASVDARLAAAEALSERRSPDCVAPLAALLGDRSLHACDAVALRGLATVGTPEAVEHVLAYCRTSPTRRGIARDALSILANARRETTEPAP
ncbi:HEAT repeat domain-containing protein, partial [Streptomyces sp.]|uniref:HEAT repeat domain-containing protein n=1 Tax=Streptomyces sp. TaxID=1931 RepID=UPI002F92B0E1